MMVAIVFLSFFMLSAAFMMLSYRYIIAEKRDAMERNADYIASFTSEYIQQSGSLDVYFRSYVATLASVSDSNVLLSDVDGDIIYASGGSSSDLSNYTDSRIPQRVLQQVLSSGSYNGLTNLDGIYSEKRYLAAYPFGIIFGGATIPQGLVLVSSDTSSVSEMWRATATIFFFTAVTVLLIAVIASSITSSHQVRPLNEMAEAARKFGQGEFDVRVTGYENRCDEVGTLAEAFNSMAASLSKVETQRSEFIANVSHELKTPIALIQAYAEGLREDIAAGTGNREYYCGVIEDESQKMSQMIKKMTLLMQLEDGSSQLEPEAFDIAELLGNLMRKNAILFEEKHAQLTLPADRPVFVRADAFLIENVLSNYLSNALHHVRDGGVVSGVIRRAGDERVRISVYNDGACIPPADLPHIWESFYKVDKARTRAYGGTGIGLSVVAAIMRAHRMPCGVFNRQDGDRTGVEFYIELEQAGPPAESI